MIMCMESNLLSHTQLDLNITKIFKLLINYLYEHIYDYMHHYFNSCKIKFREHQRDSVISHLNPNIPESNGVLTLQQES